MKRMVLLVMFILMMSSLTVNAANNATTITFDKVKSDVVEKTVSDFNAIRKSLGLEPLVINNTLKEMAQTHSKYMNYRKTLTSIEQSDFQFFRGRYPWDRAAYFNYGADYVYEFVKKDVVNYQQGLIELMNNPVGRYILLDPMYTEVGMAVEENYFTYEFGGNNNAKELFVNYPYSTQKNVPAVWKGDSFDALYKGIDLKTDMVGLPITVTYYGSPIANILDVDVILMNSNTNVTVPFELLMPGSYYLLKNTLTILPLEPYAYNTSYQVHINFDLQKKDGSLQPFTKIYSFRTEDKAVESLKSPYITRGQFTEKLVRKLLKNIIEPLELKFSDVDLSTPQGIYIYTASSEGLINGFSKTEFKPNLNITREQAYIILVRAFEKENSPILISNTNKLQSYLDKELISDWAYDYVMKAYELGIITDTNRLIKPGDYLTEEDFERILRLYNRSIVSLR